MTMYAQKGRGAADWVFAITVSFVSHLLIVLLIINFSYSFFKTFSGIKSLSLDVDLCSMPMSQRGRGDSSPDNAEKVESLPVSADHIQPMNEGLKNGRKSDLKAVEVNEISENPSGGTALTDKGNGGSPSTMGFNEHSDKPIPVAEPESESDMVLKKIDTSLDYRDRKERLNDGKPTESVGLDDDKRGMPDSAPTHGLNPESNPIITNPDDASKGASLQNVRQPLSIQAIEAFASRISITGNVSGSPAMVTQLKYKIYKGASKLDPASCPFTFKIKGYYCILKIEPGLETAYRIVIESSPPNPPFDVLKALERMLPR